MNLILPVAFLLAVIVAIGAMAVSLYHLFQVTQQVRSRATWWVNLIPFIALALPGSLTESGAKHRSKASRSLLLAAACAAIAVIARLLADR